MPMITSVYWNSSLYVTTGQPPFHKIRGQEVAPRCEGQPSAVAGSAERYFFPVASISQPPSECNRKFLDLTNRG